MDKPTTNAGSCAPRASEKGVRLRVLPDDRRTRASRVSRWRAAVLIGVNLLMAAHVAQWLWQGVTLSPVEPSESMYAIEFGLVNAGFLFFAGALLSTLIFGRFVCGWGCHMLALQDLCAHWMTKLGVRPKPFRSRLLLWAPLLMALYMFVLPTFMRVVVSPIMASAKLPWPDWLSALLGEPRAFPGFSAHLIVEDYWRTFPEWYVAIPFLGVCGFAIVYFLGAKGLCTYACPYAGFFVPAERVSIGRIVVNDDCNQCGHCTAACTSNVRVHQEIRDFGQVVDPGCMKCMDCVSVCPNDALSFKFSRPSLLARARTPEARAGHARRPRFDLSLGEDVVVVLSGLLLFVAFRAMFELVPMLMAGSMAAVGGFIVWKLLRLARTPNVRLQSLQLKYRGSLRPAGLLFVLLGGAYLAMGVWAGVVRVTLFRADIADRAVHATYDEVFGGKYTPKPEVKAAAERALTLYRSASNPGEGGIGWIPSNETLVRMSWLSAASGDMAGAERYVRRAIDRRLTHHFGQLTRDQDANPDWISGLVRMMVAQGRSIDEVRASLADLLDRAPRAGSVGLALASINFQSGHMDDAATIARRLAGDTSRPSLLPQVVAGAADLLINMGRVKEARDSLERQAAARPKTAVYFASLARARVLSQDNAGAVEAMQRAASLEPRNPYYWQAVGDILQSLGKPNEAQDAYDKAKAAAGVK